MCPDQERKDTESAEPQPATNQLEVEHAIIPTANNQLAIDYAGTPIVEDQIETESATNLTVNEQPSKKRQESSMPFPTAPHATAYIRTTHRTSCASEDGCERHAKCHVNPQCIALSGDVASNLVASNEECFELKEHSGYNVCRCPSASNKGCLDLPGGSGHIERHRPAAQNKDFPDFEDSARTHRRPVATNKECIDLYKDEESGHIRRRPAASNKEYLDSHEDSERTEHRRPIRPTESTVSTSFLTLLGNNILQISAKVAWMMQWPFAVLICAFACIYMYKATWRIGGELVSASLQPVCQLPGFHMLPICSIATTTTTAIPLPISYADKVIGRADEIAVINKFASRHADKPLNLLQGQSSMRSLMLELAGLDLPNKGMLLSFVEQLNDLAEKSIETMEDSLCKTNALVDNTMISNAWAKDKLILIEARSHSALAPLYRFAEIIGLSRASAVKDVEATFMQYNDMLHGQAGDVLLQFQLSHQTLKDLRTLIVSMTTALAQEGRGLEDQQLSEASYWKMILQPHAARMRNFEKLTAACAKFCKDLERADEVVRLTSRELIQVRARVRAFQDQLEVKSLDERKAGNEAGLIELTIERLSASIKNLDEAKKASRADKRRRLENFDRDMESNM